LLLHYFVQLQQLAAQLGTLVWRFSVLKTKTANPQQLTMLRAASLILSNSSMQHTPCSEDEAPLGNESILQRSPGAQYFLGENA
jgi:hypothetical protein